jgi:CubicO group peptidase (beta-lactamase class C family)|tara:strand:+ start:92 stop:343 length:252 start_codon:yes stop_codon:yes gene_type:complete
MDLMLMFPVKFAMGYAYGSDFIPITPNKNAIWWAGLGGSSCVIDQENRTCFSYVMNQMKASMFRWALFRRALFRWVLFQSMLA